MIGYLLGALGALAYMLLSGKSGASTPAANSGSVVQTASVTTNKITRLYTITRLGGGKYAIVLTSRNGNTNNFPVSILFDQEKELQEFAAPGSEADLAQMKLDIPAMQSQVNFKS